jgi:uncharacterized protein with FMN-binding domain
VPQEQTSSTGERYNPRVADKKVANGVVALGSVAVMAVYGAGYAKTRAAADRFAEQAAERRPHIPAGRGDQQATALALDAPGPEVAAIAPPPSGEPTTAVAPESRPAALNTPIAKPAVEARSVEAATKVTKTTAPAAAATAASAIAPAPSDDEESAALAQTSAVQPPATPPIAASAPAAQPAPAAPQAPAPVPAPAPPAAAPQVPAKATYKDGTFYGWGTSRHGDIQAAVVIENGRITVARVERCLTRYSCSWIAPLPPRVLLKQGNTYDYVSGATESSDAFQDAVAEALSTAK